MKWDYTERDYQIHKISQALPMIQADSLAKSWAAAMGIEIRL